MNRKDRIERQNRADEVIRKKRKGKNFLLKTDTLVQRARKLGIATDMPYINRSSRRTALKEAVQKERKAIRRINYGKILRRNRQRSLLHTRSA